MINWVALDPIKTAEWIALFPDLIFYAAGPDRNDAYSDNELVGQWEGIQFRVNAANTRARVALRRVGVNPEPK